MKTQSPGPLKKVLLHPARITIAAVVSLLAARLLGLPEAFWAPISAMIVAQTNLDAALTISWQRLVGTALGSAAGALLSICFGPGVIAYGAGVLGLGLLCAGLRLDRSAYRFAGITLTIVMFAAKSEPAWVIAIHRCCAVCLGILIGVVVIAICPETERTQGT